MMRTSNMKIIGQDANGKNLCVCHFECDSAADLPAYNVYQSDGYVFAMSSTAHTIDTDKKYELTSAGTWIEQSQPWQPLADYSVLSNKPKINGHTLIGNQSGEALGLQNALTFDRTPTQDSANPVTSGGVFTDQQRQEAEIGAVANAGAKNLLKITASSRTLKGVTFTVNDDRTVTVNGTNDGTGASTFVIVPNEQAITIPDGNYILSGCPTDGGIPYDLRWYQYSNGKSAYDIGAGASVTKNGNTSESNIAIVVKTGQTANNVVFSPMLRPASITDPTFQPYAPTNRELYDMILALQSGGNRALTMQQTESTEPEEQNEG